MDYGTPDHAVNATRRATTGTTAGGGSVSFGANVTDFYTKLRAQYKATRRRILWAGLALGGSLAVSARTQEKLAPAQVQYQATSKDGHRCSACVNFEPPAACIVSGAISPTAGVLRSHPRRR
jgi:hypothetical protein